MFEKWKSCIFSVRLMFSGEDGYILRQEGFIDDYGCTHPRVIKDSVSTSLFLENDMMTPVAILHGFGRLDDPEVLEALNRTCGNCSYFQACQRVS